MSLFYWEDTRTHIPWPQAKEKIEKHDTTKQLVTYNNVKVCFMAQIWGQQKITNCNVIFDVLTMPVGIEERNILNVAFTMKPWLEKALRLRIRGFQEFYLHFTQTEENECEYCQKRKELNEKEPTTEIESAYATDKEYSYKLKEKNPKHLEITGANEATN